MLPLLLGAALATAQAQDRPPMGANFRYRSLWVPDTIIDTWYFTEDEGALEERPSVGAAVYGLEYTIEKDPTVFLFYVEYMKARLDAGYWDDKEDPAQHNDGDWIQPEGLGAVVLGANYGHELKITPDDKDVWLGFLVSGGLGLGIATGHLNQWKPGPTVVQDAGGNPAGICGPEQTSLVRKDECDPDDTPGIWPVFPMVDVSVALRLHVTEYATARFDFGLHDMLYAGGAIGGVF